MGSALSLNGSKTRFEEHSEVSVDETCKRQRLSSSISEENENVRLIPNLPDEISFQILARVPRIFYLNMRLVSRSWKGAIMSTELFNLRKELGTTEEWLYILTKIKDDKLLWYSLDPLSRRWQRLPPMPNVAHEDGGFSRASALTSVWRYDPVQNGWSEVSPMSIGRAYCKTGVLNNKLYVIGGVTRGRGGLIPLQSAEVFDPRTGEERFMILRQIHGLKCLLAWVRVGLLGRREQNWGAIVDDELYALDPSSSADIATIKLHVITKDANNNFTVLQANMQNHLHSFPLTPLSPLGNNSSEQTESVAESETDVWKVIAARSAGACELVGPPTDLYLYLEMIKIWSSLAYVWSEPNDFNTQQDLLIPDDMVLLFYHYGDMFHANKAIDASAWCPWHQILAANINSTLQANLTKGYCKDGALMLKKWLICLAFALVSQFFI
ncbi:F-box/kelch-repeat protein [Vitis vinifera]|uniref:F-box/kelch-repeat protein n=1 Tax=Vitis vinifera TaxID=29760 RepID=A0A438CM04_VITVI|nr:F-box/kelch-repeat protein [Vitis vinifera]